ncbi:MADS-box protein SVP-like isoform X2 [Vitis riparia]|uniref:MADS-box protein SVP-like isoform X2 n=1 Tax=Vitis riparia TaxID=96939 RepID=UPI00155AE3FB|nr:MADS-box protein SVP-like isoform X2 [Vitis riparia]
MIFLASHHNGTTDTKALQSIRCEVSDEVLSTFPHERERERGAPRLGRGRGLPLQHTMKQRDKRDRRPGCQRKRKDMIFLATMAPLTRRHCSPSVVSVSQVIGRHTQHPQTPEKPEPPSLELQVENSTCAALSKEIAQQTQRLRQMKGEELQVLKIEELTELEELLEAGLCSVVEEKAERIRTEISDLQRKGDVLQEENERLRKEGHSSESITNNICSLLHPNQGHHDSDTSLKLGLPFSN